MAATSSSAGPSRQLPSPTTHFRNLFSVSMPHQTYEGLNVQLTSPTLIKTNGRHFAVPWARAKGANTPYLAVLSLGSTGKITQPPFCISACQQQVGDFEFSPFAEELLATSDRDSGMVKVWKHPTWQLTSDLTTPDLTLSGHQKKVDFVRFNPAAEGILLSASSDLSMKIWDVVKMAEVQTLKGGSEVFTSASWSYSGNMLLTASKDGMIRFFDPRDASCASGEVKTDYNAIKGINTLFLGDHSILSAGFSKSSERTVQIWDPRHFKTPKTQLPFGTKPGPLVPFFDATIGILYITAKGEGVTLFEMNEKTRDLQQICECKSEKQQTALALLPKYLSDMDNCEVARMLRLSNENYVQAVSIRVPRKSKATHFQEDLYPPMAHTEAGITAEEWRQGKKAELKLKNFKPSNAVSVYEASAEEGGVARPGETLEGRPSSKSGSGALEGELQIKKQRALLGPQYKKRWATIAGNRVMLSREKGSSEGARAIPLHDASRITVAGEAEDPHQITFTVQTSARPYVIKAQSTAARDQWVRALAKASGVEVASEVAALQMAPRAEAKAALPKPLFEGSLSLYAGGKMGGSKWVPAHVVLEADFLTLSYTPKGTLRSHLSPKEEMESVRLCEVISARRPEVAFGAASEGEPHLVMVNTGERCIALQGRDAAQTDLFLRQLQEATAKALKSSSKAYAESELPEIVNSLASSVEGYLSRKNMGVFQSTYVAILGGEVQFFAKQLSRSPALALPGARIEEVRPLPQACELMVMASGKEHVLSAPAGEIRDFWQRKLKQLQDAQMNMYERLDMEKVLGDQAALQELERATKDRFIDTDMVRQGKHPLLYRVTGKKAAKFALVPTSADSLDGDAIFILDCGKELYQWNGSRTSRVCRARGADIANRIRKEERSCNATITDVNDYPPQVFLRALGVSNVSELAAAEWRHGENSDAPAPARRAVVYKIADSPDTKKRIQILFNDETDLPTCQLFSPNGVYVVDGGEGGVFVWVGSSAHRSLEKQGVAVGRRLISQRGRSPHTLTLVRQEYETLRFKEFFKDFQATQTVTFQRQPEFAV